MVEFDIKSFAEKLKFAREYYNLSQQQVANILKIDRSTYSYYELGKTQPNLNTLFAISQIFCISIDNMMDPNIKADKNILREDEKIDFLKYYKMRIEHLKKLCEELERD